MTSPVGAGERLTPVRPTPTTAGASATSAEPEPRRLVPAVRTPGSTPTFRVLLGRLRHTFEPTPEPLSDLSDSVYYVR